MKQTNDIVDLWMKFCEANNATFIEGGQGIYTFRDKVGRKWWYLSEKQLRELFD
ncbi:hypothetical protein [Peribacillus muralis]|uniref:hypothetical protein n=1 Tax=Peribacillus muralis TaxID=264697 RepID=UPI000A7DECBF|nr:hypothetical protein [Peribacillus muralis]